MPSLKERAKTLLDLIDGAHFIFADRPLALDAKAAALVTPETRGLVGELKQVLEAVSPWTVETTEAAVRGFAETKGLKLGAAAQPMRIALNGADNVAGYF